MFKQLIISILLPVFFLQVFKGPFLVVDYYTNKAKFENNCINKARPLMHCHGKCQMMKQLQAQQKKEQEEIENKLNIKFESLAPVQLLYAIAPHKINFNKYALQQNYQASNNFSFDILHPPRVIFV